MSKAQHRKRSSGLVDAEYPDETSLTAGTGSQTHPSSNHFSSLVKPLEYPTSQAPAVYANETVVHVETMDAERSPSPSSSPSGSVSGRSPTQIWTLEKYLQREQEYDPISPARTQQVKRDAKKKVSHLWNKITAPDRHPALVIIGQTLILSTAWSFSLFVYYKQVVPLPVGLALTTTNNPTVLTLAVTLLATIISAISSLLLSFSIRYAINYYLLYRSLPVITLGNSIKVLNRSLIFDIKHVRWMFIAIFAVLMTGAQTAGWTTLVTPIGITIQTPLRGVELDITNDQYISNFRKMKGQAGASVLLTNIREYIELGGVSNAISVSPNGKSQINYLDLTFNVSTNGIIPTNIHAQESSDDRQALSGNPGVLATVDQRSLPTGLSGNFTAHNHQGLTANVTCYPWIPWKDDPMYQTNYVVSSTDIVQPSTGNSSLDGNAATLYTYRYSWNCNNNTKWTDYLYTFDNSTLAAISCPDERKEDIRGPTNYTLVLVGGSGVDMVRSTTVVCHIVPQVTLVEVDYSGMVNTTKRTVLPNVTAEAMSDLGVYVVQRLFSLAQRQIGNSIAESLSNIAVAQGKGTRDGQIAYHLIGAFIKGAFEYTATVIGDAIRFDEGPTFRNLTGVYRTQTVGYSSQPGVALISLLPITCVGLGSLFIILFVFVHQHQDHREQANLNSKDGSRTAYSSFIDFNEPRNLESNSTHAVIVAEEGSVFDVGDPLHLLAVASSGGISDVFRSGLRDAQMEASHKVNLKLGSLVDAENGGRRIGLKHDDRQWLGQNTSYDPI